MSNFTLTTTFGLKKYNPGVRGWGGDNNANLDVLDQQLALSQDASWVTSGTFDAARLPSAAAAVLGAVMVAAGANLTLDLGTGALSLTGANVNAALGGTAVLTSDLGAANGVATLGADGKLTSGQLPAIALTAIMVVASQAARLALTTDDVQPGHAVKEADTGKLYLLTAADPSVNGNWTELANDNAVVTVNGQSGTSITLTTSDVAEGSNLYFTTGRVQAVVSKAYVESVLTGEITSHVHDTRYLQLTGGTLTGPLTLSGAPSSNLHAATKIYVDNGLATKLDVAGGTMTGALVLSGDPTQNLHATTKNYTDSGLALKANLAGATFTGSVILAADPVVALGAATKGYTDTALSTAVANYLPLAGGTLTGALVLSGLPVSGNQAASKTYVDNTAANYLLLSGGTLTGDLILGAAPTVALGAATKGYVDTGLNLKAALAGATFTGDVILAADPATGLGAATKNYVDAQIGASAGVASIRFGTGTILNGAVTVDASMIASALAFTPENAANKGVSNGYAPLGVDSKIPSSYLPAIALTTGQVVADQAARLALSAADVQPGDFVKQADTAATYLLAAADPSVNGNWIEIASDNAVLSVNGHTGTSITLTTSDLAEGTNLYYTDARVQTFGDARYLKLAGGTLTGPLLLAADPVTGLGAATKSYVDNQITAFAGVTSFNTRTGAVVLTLADVTTALTFTPANKAGDTFTGSVIVTRAASANSALSALVTGDTFNRFTVTAGGVLNFGSGAAATDTTITRTGSGILVMNGLFQANTFSGSGAFLTSLPAPQLTGLVPDASLDVNVVRRGQLQVMELQGEGDFTQAGAAILDYEVAKRAFTIGRILISGLTPAAGTLTLDLQKKAGPGATNAPTTLFTTVAKPVLTGNNDIAVTDLTGATLPDIVAIAAGEILVLKISASSANFDNVEVQIFEAP